MPASCGQARVAGNAAFWSFRVVFVFPKRGGNARHGTETKAWRRETLSTRTAVSTLCGNTAEV
jgi:hypothetical protein